MKVNMKPLTFSFAVSLSIASFFLLATFWIFYEYSGSDVSANDALNTTSSYFGAVATLGAAIIAAYLFNDWRDQHRANYISSVCKNISNAVTNIHQKIFELNSIILESERLRDNRPIALISQEQRDQIFKNIPYIENLCNEILYKVKALECEMIQLEVITNNSCKNIEQLYEKFRQLVDKEANHVLSSVDDRSKYQKISRSRSLISVVNDEYKDFQRSIYKKIYELNNPK